MIYTGVFLKTQEDKTIPQGYEEYEAIDGGEGLYDNYSGTPVLTYNGKHIPDEYFKYGNPKNNSATYAFGKNISSLGTRAFFMSSLQKLYLPNLKFAEGYCVHNNTLLADVFLPKLTVAGDEAFSSCSSITNFSLPKLTQAGVGSFSGCSKLESFSAPTLKAVTYRMFAGNTKMSSVDVRNITRIDGLAFSKCYSLLSPGEMPYVISVGEEAFASCRNLREISFQSATTIKQQAFIDCWQLRKISIPNVTKVGKHAFIRCRNLNYIYCKSGMRSTIARNLEDSELSNVYIVEV